MERWRRRRGKRRDWGEVSTRARSGTVGDLCAGAGGLRSAGVVPSGPRDAPPQRGFLRWGDAHRCDALSREQKGDPPGWASPGGSGVARQLSQELGVDLRVLDPSSHLVLESRVFPTAEGGWSFLCQGCPRTLEPLDHPGKRPRPWRGGSVRWVSAFASLPARGSGHT